MEIRERFSFLSGALLIGLLLTGTAGLAQHLRPALPVPSANTKGTVGAATRSQVFDQPRAGEAGLQGSTSRWANRVMRMSPRNPTFPEVEAIKQAKMAAKLASKETASPDEGAPKSVTPAIGVDFEGNWSQVSTPPDNSMAVSNGGKIVSCNNDGIEYYDATGAFTFGASWPDFFNDGQLNSNIYDPKVLYDSGADRFFLTVLHGTSSSSTLLLLCFSKTNDPAAGWWTFYLPGSPLQNGTWFDYPSIGVSNNEVYVSGNLFTDGNNQFQQAILFQITKSGGYNGAASLNWQYWYGLTDQPYAAFTVVPASWGQQGNYGPGILLLSGNSPGANSLRLWDLTDDLTGTPALNVYDVSTAAYSPAANAQMPGSPDELSSGDCRMLNAFYLNGLVHYAFGTDVGSGWNGLRYGRIDINSLTDANTSFGTPGVADLSYPALASYSTSTSDHSVMLAFLRSSSQVFPEVRVVNCDNALQWSGSTLVKAGENSVDFLQGAERWGDYTGACRRHNANPPRMWLAGCYGSGIQGGLQNTWKTWIAEVGDGAVGVPESTVSAPAPLLLAPNPTLDLFRLTFHVDTYAMHTIEVLDITGRVVKILYKDALSAGDHQLSFNRDALAAGQYVVSIRTANKQIANEALIIH
ncbi:MAG: T9SS type A sorting domain-containing protein [Flavobacteriales bacterium]|nr:T9SS type A sorting domain-containing protein [Flavobacteriales bacterium]